jgi:hypothetical protein
MPKRLNFMDYRAHADACGSIDPRTARVGYHKAFGLATGIGRRIAARESKGPLEAGLCPEKPGG